MLRAAAVLSLLPAAAAVNTSASECNQEVPGPPNTVTEHNGVAWPTLCVSKTKGTFFGIGDWGGDGAPGTTWRNPGVRRALRPIDSNAQGAVAREMKRLAARVQPDFVLSAGDNLYPGGIWGKCTDRDQALGGARMDRTGQFARYHDNMYAGPGLDGKPWMSVLGNHDYGGMSFDTAWDLQIYRTWMNYNGQGTQWIMPAMYWTRKVQYQDFAVDLYFIESNFLDAQAPHLDKNHNMCGSGSHCWGIGQYDCPGFFRKAWAGSLAMLEEGLRTTTSDWRIVVTHFPGPSMGSMLRRFGPALDLLFTGHTHFQTTGTSNGMFWVISGGGGGVTSDAMPSWSGQDGAYGFTSMTVTRNEMTIELRSWGGPAPGREMVTNSQTLRPKRGRIVV